MAITNKAWLRTTYWLMGIVLGCLIAAIIASITYVEYINQTIDRRIEQLRSPESSQFYAIIPPIKRGMRLQPQELKMLLDEQGYSEREEPSLVPGSFAWDKTADRISLIRPTFSEAGTVLDPVRVQLELLRQDNLLIVDRIRYVDSDSEQDTFESLPKRIGHFRAGRLRTQNPIPLSEMPTNLRLAVIAVEDANFLDHLGISFKGILRALLKNLIARKFVQGGSTITQQLMKNLFFGREKVFSRKFMEAFFALVTEARFSKETILEAYLNEVYLGQWSTHEIHGVEEASRYYFFKPVSELTLAQAATLAAVIRAPNLYDPRRNTKRTIERRDFVLKRMLESEFILQEEYQAAVQEPLRTVPLERTLEDVHYFMGLVMEQLPTHIKHRMDSEALTIYVTMNPSLQSVAAEVLTRHLNWLEKSNASLKKRAQKGMHLQGALVAIQPKDCTVLALQGGRSYKQTQFNRITQGFRQPGSLFKPFVILASLSQSTENPLTPISQIEDAPFEWAYDNHVWIPKNYDNKFRGAVTIRQVLEDSLNIPTARIAQKIGIDSILDILKQAGFNSKLPTVPSVSLGSADVTPLEVAQSFTTLANMGTWCQLRPFLRIYDEGKNLIFDNALQVESRLPNAATFQTVDLLKGVLIRGTAKSSQTSGLPLVNFAGKTGTTNDAKDAWFVGFSPNLLVLVWIGYDEKESVGLTGAAAALPIWIDFIKGSSSLISDEDFSVPGDLVKVSVDKENYLVSSGHCPAAFDEYFQRGTEPVQRCPYHR